MRRAVLGCHQYLWVAHTSTDNCGSRFIFSNWLQIGDPATFCFVFVWREVLHIAYINRFLFLLLLVLKTGCKIPGEGGVQVKKTDSVLLALNNPLTNCEEGQRLYKSEQILKLTQRSFSTNHQGEYQRNKKHAHKKTLLKALEMQISLSQEDKNQNWN